jgi:hypothetical protein
MILESRNIEVIVVAPTYAEVIDFRRKIDRIVLFKDGLDRGQETFEISAFKLTEFLHSSLMKGTTNIAFISQDDMFNVSALVNILWNFNNTPPKEDRLGLLIPYKHAPLINVREDGNVVSFIVSSNILALSFNFNRTFARITYALLLKYLSLTHRKNMVEIFHVGQPGASEKRTFPYNAAQALARRSLLIIPHKGSVKYLKRLICSLNQSEYLPGLVNLCFDDATFKKLPSIELGKLQDMTMSYRNSPLGVGPYLARHYSIVETSKEYIFFQDSDDIPSKTRFIGLIRELEERELDLIGSHEIRVDQFQKCVLVVRMPLDVNQGLLNGGMRSLLHPTSMIKRIAYLRTGGFSTDLTFGYDTQFLCRACFSLRIGNVDDFLYIRFKRKKSLTTKRATRIGSPLRTLLIWRWKTDFQLICDNELDLAHSSLAVRKHNFEYRRLKV